MAKTTTRRDFLGRVLAVGCSTAAAPIVTPVTFAAAPVEARLVVMVLRGAMDGLDAVRPYGDPGFARARPGLGGGPGSGSADLDGFFALHPALGDLAPLWQAGEFAAVHAVSTPYRDKRSHFDGQDFLENGGFRSDGAMSGPGDGWLNRLLPLIGGAGAETAFAVGRSRLRLLAGSTPYSSWSPDAGLDLSRAGQLLLEHVYQGDPLFHDAAATAMALSAETDPVAPGRASRAEALARYAGERLNGETRIAAFSLAGFDTHRAQEQVLPRALGEVQTAILTLKRTLGENWNRTAVLAVTEFGRTVRENGSGGTDHGTGGVMLMAGGAIRGGRVLGRWPGLGPGDLYEDRDLMPTDDVRRYAGWAMRGLFGVATSDIERQIFPELDMGSDPGLIG